MSVSTWAATREMTNATTDVHAEFPIPPRGAVTSVRRRDRNGAGARERFVTTQRPALRLVPPLSERAAWPPDTTASSNPGADESPLGRQPIGASAPTDQSRFAATFVPLVARRRRQSAVRETERSAVRKTEPSDARRMARNAVLDVAPSTVRRLGPARVAAPGHSIAPIASAASTAAAHPTIRLTRRGRAVLAVVVLIFAAALVAVLASNVQAAAPSSPPRAIVVHPGDTLWSIAARVHPRGSLTDTMLAIERLNHMSDGTVYVGQQLLVPRS